MKHNNPQERAALPRKKARLLLSAGMTAALLSSCTGEEGRTPRPIPAVEVAHEQAEKAGVRLHLASLNIMKASTYEQVYDPDVSVGDKITAAYQSIKEYVEYAKENNVPLQTEVHGYQLGGYYSCSIDGEDGKYNYRVSSSGPFGMYSAYVFISPDSISVGGEYDGRPFNILNTFSPEVIEGVTLELGMVQSQIANGGCFMVEAEIAAKNFFQHTVQAPNNGGGGAGAGTM